MIKLFLLCCILIGCQGEMNYTNVESVLLRVLMANYDANARPVLNHSEPVPLSFGIGYRELVEMEEKKQLLTSNVWVRQKWKDPWLTWNISDYNGIASIHVNPKLLWRPDLLLYNKATVSREIGKTCEPTKHWEIHTAHNHESSSLGDLNSVNDENRGELFLFETPIIVYNDGTIFWYSPAKIKTSCKIDITYFPFDTQTCMLKFGLWTYDGLKVDIQFLNGKEEADLAIFTENGEWELVSAKAKRGVMFYSCCPEPYPDLTFYIKIKRRTLFYINNLIIPCILLALLAAVSFLFPPETGERVALVITVLLGMTVFMLIFTEAIPPNSESQSLIGRYFGAILFELAISLFMTCGILRLYHHNPESEVPLWAKRLVFGVLARVFGCGICLRSQNLSSFKIPIRKPLKVHTSELSMKEGLQNVRVVNVVEKQSNGVDQSCDKANFKEIKVEGLETLSSYIEELQADKRRAMEWHALVKVLDTFSFWIFVFTIFLSTIAMLPVVKDT